MRSVTHSVVVCTSTHHGEPRAMTMSSFTSLTLTPTPLVTFNVATPSRTLDAIAWSGEFNVHILAGDARGMALADILARGNTDGGMAMPLEMEEGGTGPPLLRQDGVLYVLRCRLAHEAASKGLVKVRDHMIVIGEVMELIPMESEGGEGEFGLVYADREYRSVGDVIPRGGAR